MKKLITILAIILTTSSVFAQAPNLMSYQAVIRNSSGNLITTSVIGMRISILQGSSSGTIVYSETQTPTTNANGLISLVIGNGSVITGSISSINWASGVYYIKTEVDPVGGTAYTLTSTSQFLSVPYSLYSVSSGDTTMWKKNGTNIYYNNGAVGIGNNGGLYSGVKLQINGGNIYAGQTNGSSLTLGDASWSSTLRDSVLTGYGSSLLLQTQGTTKLVVTGSAGNIGIGTTAPPSKLTVTGGDVNITNIASGIIMKSPNAQCWRVTVDNTGALISTSITCP